MLWNQGTKFMLGLFIHLCISAQCAEPFNWVSANHYPDMIIKAAFVVNKINSRAFHLFLCRGPFNNYVDKMRWGGGQKMSVFVHAECIKTPRRGDGDQKMAKFCPSSCWLAPSVEYYYVWGSNDRLKAFFSELWLAGNYST